MTRVRAHRRDPARKERILTASAELISKHGCHAVGLADIGTAAGIVSTGVYRHFESKAAILAALLQVMGLLGHTAHVIVRISADDRVALGELVHHHVRIAIHDRRIMQVYHLEARSAGVLVHAAVGAIQSILFHNSGLPEDRLTALPCAAAHACLGVEPLAEVHERSLDVEEPAVTADSDVN